MIHHIIYISLAGSVTWVFWTALNMLRSSFNELEQLAKEEEREYDHHLFI